MGGGVGESIGGSLAGACGAGARRAPCALLAICLLLLAPARAPGEDAREIERLNAENAALRERVARLEKENAELRVLAGLAPPAGAEAASAARVTSAYDESRGLTSVTGRPSRLEVLEGIRGRYWMRLRYEHPGREPAAVERVALELEVASAREAFRSARTLRLTIDGVDVQCPVVGYRATQTTVGSSNRQVGAREVVIVEVPRAVLGQVAGAQDVRGTLERTVFRLTPEQIVEFRVFQRRLDG